jgi:hypothetical protein
VLRVRWFEVDDPASQVEWAALAPILAALFFNAVFWLMHDTDLWRFNWPPFAFAASCAVGIACAALFFVGPALAAQAADSFRSLLASAFGTVPGFCVQMACVVYLVTWISRLLSLVCLFLGLANPPRPAIELGMIGGAILLLVYLTGCQSVRTSSALARFTLRLAAAIMIAALIRVRSGWFAIPSGLASHSQFSLVEDTWRSFSDISFYVAPLALLAAIFSARLASRKAVAMTALMGITAPLAVNLLVGTILGVATRASDFYRPSGFSNIFMSLASGTPHVREKAVLLIFAVTILGVLRFSVAALKEVATVPWVPPRFAWIPFGCLISATVWYSVHSDWEVMVPVVERSTEILVSVAAILTVDALMRRQFHQPQAFDWAFTLSLLCGIGVPAFIRFWWSGTAEDSWGHPWLLPSYGISFVVYLFARAVARVSARSGAFSRRLSPD